LLKKQRKTLEVLFFAHPLHLYRKTNKQLLFLFLAPFMTYFTKFDHFILSIANPYSANILEQLQQAKSVHVYE